MSFERTHAIFAFVPIGRAADPRKTHIRIGRCKVTKRIRDRFHGLNVPKLVLLDLVVPDAEASLGILRDIMRGHQPLWFAEHPGRNVRFTSWYDFRQSDYGSMWFTTAFPEDALRLFFGEIEKYFSKEPGDGNDVRACLEANRSKQEDVYSNPIEIEGEGEVPQVLVRRAVPESLFRRPGLPRAVPGTDS